MSRQGKDDIFVLQQLEHSILNMSVVSVKHQHKVPPLLLISYLFHKIHCPVEEDGGVNTCGVSVVYQKPGG